MEMSFGRFCLVLLSLCSIIQKKPVLTQTERDSPFSNTRGNGSPNFVYMQFPQRAPGITTLPLDHRVQHNNRVMFFCQANGHPTPSIYWQKDDRRLTDRRNRYTQTSGYSSSLTLETVTEREEGVYQCVADNGVGSPAVANATLRVYADGQALPDGFPVITASSDRETIVIELGFAMKLVCSVSGTPKPQVIWYKNKIPVEIDGARVKIDPQQGNEWSNDLAISSTADGDSGQYECMGRNIHGTVYSRTVTVYIRDGSLGGRGSYQVRKYSPQFTVRPPLVNHVMAGGSLNLTCVAVGSPMPYVRWSKQGDRIGDQTNSPIGRNVLQLTNIQESANYTCRAASDLGTIELSTEIRVEALPDAPQDVRVRKVLPSSAEIQWSPPKPRTGSITSSGPKYLVQFRTKDNEDWSERGEDEINYMLSYNLTGLQPYTFYQLRVIPFSNHGRGIPSQVFEFRTEETEPESPPQRVTAKAVSRTTALISWNAPLQPNGDITEYNIYYTPVSGANRPLEEWMVTKSTNTLVVISNLVLNEIYAVSVQARTRIGYGPKSEPIRFTMVPGVPLAPRNLQVLQTSSRAISLGWERPEGTDSILSYEIYINNSRTRQPTVKSVMPPTENFILEDLIPNTYYNIKITARSANGEGPHTNTIQVKTEEAEPSAPPVNIVAKAPRPDASTSLRVTWEPPSANLANGVITGYKVYYIVNRISDDKNASMVPISNASQTAYQIENLEVYTDYRVWMKASTLVGDGPSSSPVTGRTGESVPEAPKMFNLLALNSSAVLVTWRKPMDRDANGVIRGYQLFQSKVSPTGERVGETKMINIVEGDAVDYTVTGLEPRTKYIFQIRAFTIAGDGGSTKGKTVETLGAVPTAPQNMRLELVNEDPVNIKVTWDPPQESHGQIKSYKLEWGRRDGEDTSTKTVSVSSSRQSYITESLLKGAEYEFKLQAENDENYGEAAIDLFRTPDGVPSGMPQNITARYRSEDSAIISWEPPHPRQRNGVIIMYQVRYQDKDNAIDLRAENTSETSLIIEKLTSGSKYFIQVVAFTSAGAGPTSHRIIYNTVQTRPPAPLAVSAIRTNRTSIKVTWTPPPTSVTGYKIYYTTQDTGEGIENWLVKETNQPTTTYILTGLEPTRAYAVKVQAVGIEGEPGLLSSEAIVNEIIPPVVTPTSVRALSSNVQTATSIRIAWSPPSKDGAKYYRVKHRGVDRKTKQEQAEVVQIVASTVYECVLSGLKPDHIYTIEVSVQYDGESEYTGKAVINETTKAVPTPMLRVDVTSPIIAMSREDNKFDSIYVVVVLSSERRLPEEITLSVLMAPKQKRSLDTTPYIAAQFDGSSTINEFSIGDGKEFGTFVNRELSPGVEYKAFFKVTIDGAEYSSAYSTVFTSKGPVAAPITEKEDIRQQGSLALIIGPVGGGVVILVIIIIIIVIIRKKKQHKKEKAPEHTKIPMEQPPSYPTDPVELRRLEYSTPGMQNHPPIPITQLASHIDALKASDNLKFSQEYESIEPGQQFTWDHSNQEYNKPKNRYANVIAYDHSRVVLQPLEGSPGSDYINANYMDGYRKQNAYISTQGPLQETFGDFWRMVWEQRSATIVMMTRLEERARIKCDRYWPVEGTEQYGPIIVTLTNIMELATYTVRTFQISRNGWAENREVRQYQFTAWPDHGVPDYPTPLLIFMRRVKAATPSESGPMVVHCSAGVGRTGAFIVIDAMLERIKHEKTVDIYGHVTCLRAKRNYMVQTEDQYIFIHDALLDAVQSGNTEIPVKNLCAHISRLNSDSESPNGLQREFKALTNFKVDPARFASANLPVNKFKNRLVNVLPYENNRVSLQPIRGVDGSDYINASYIDGYRFKKAYIATQGPLRETTEDFWRMLWEHNSTIIVMLTKLKEMGREKCHQYWPDTRSVRYQYFVVDPHAEYDMQEYTLREFKVTDARDGQSRTIRLFQFNDWPEQGVPQNGGSFIQFIGQVHKTKEQFGQEGPITVHCSAGVGVTGVFITLSIVLERMRYESVVDMNQTVKMLRTQRQGMVQTEEQYSFCYQAALHHLGSFDNYY